MNITKKQILTYTAILFTGLLLGWLIFGGSQSLDDHADHDQLTEAEMDQHVMNEHTDDEGNIVYTCSMHPSVRQNEPGNCPICGMDLIPAGSQNTEAQSDEYSMVMTASAARLADIQTSPVVRRVPKKVLDLPGRVQVDERRLTHVTTHFPGRIRDLKIDFTGASIRRGEVMATIYSPELIAAQRELLEAAQQIDRNPRLYKLARQKFRLWEFTEEQISNIVERGSVQNELEILSPADGYVMTLNVAEEQHVMEGTVIFEVANLDRIWVVLEAYEEDLKWISIGDTFTFQTRTHPGETQEATVSFIDPVVDSRTRTVRVRADLTNSNERLKPDMLVRARLNSRMQDEKLLVPASSVLWTGKRSLVYVKDTSADVPRFEAKLVELGTRTGDFYVIEEGLEEGQEVVFNGAFRIDSEMQLADKFSMMNREPGTGRGAPSMPGMDMGGDMDMDMDDKTSMDIDQDEARDYRGQTPDEFKEKLTGLVDIYLDVKNALIESDPNRAAKTAGQAKDQLESMEHDLKGEAMQKWMNIHQKLMVPLESMAETDDLDEIRSEFSSLSELFVEAVQSFEIEGAVFHIYCSMEEATWLSSEEQIENPYMAETMPGCGEVIERIE